MSCRILLLTAFAISLCACSTVNNKRADGSFEYQDKDKAPEIKIPANLKEPKQSKDFYITDDISFNGPVGEEMDIRAPTLVMPVAASSRVVEESGISIIWFDKVLESHDLLEFMENVVKEQMLEEEMTYHYVEEDIETTLSKVLEGANSLKETSIRREGLRSAIIETDWYHEEIDTGWIFTDIEVAESYRFRFQMLAKSHGRSVSLRVLLVDYLKTTDDGGSKTMDPIDKQRAEKAMLNKLIANVDYNYRVQLQQERLKRANQQLVTIGKNITEEPAYVVEIGLDDLWTSMPLFFEEHGFTITDLNQDKMIYYVDFVQPDVSVWDTIWGDAAPVIDVSDSHYQFVFSPLDSENQTVSVTIYDSNGEPLTVEVLERIFPVMEKGLSFKEFF